MTQIQAASNDNPGASGPGGTPSSSVALADVVRTIEGTIWIAPPKSYYGDGVYIVSPEELQALIERLEELAVGLGWVGGGSVNANASFWRTSVRCGVCGRRLTAPKSVRRGIGPVCWRRGGGRVQQHGAAHDGCRDLFLVGRPVQESGVVLQRDAGGRVHTNVPHLVTHHSPSGFEFGYGGSGPADLALNIVEFVLRGIGYRGPVMGCMVGQCYERAWMLHHDFKWEFVATMPQQEGGVIPYGVAVGWVRAHPVGGPGGEAV